MLLAILILTFANLVLGVARGWMIYNQLETLEQAFRSLLKQLETLEQAFRSLLKQESESDWYRTPHYRANFLSELKKLSPEQLGAYLSALKFHGGAGGET